MFRLSISLSRPSFGKSLANCSGSSHPMYSLKRFAMSYAAWLGPPYSKSINEASPSSSRMVLAGIASCSPDILFAGY